MPQPAGGMAPPGLLLLLLLLVGTTAAAATPSASASHTRRLLLHDNALVPAGSGAAHPTAWPQPQASQHARSTQRRLLITALISASGLTDRPGRSNASAAAPAAPPAPVPRPTQPAASQQQQQQQQQQDASQPSSSDPSSWQRRTLQLPPHVYLISFVMLLAIMVALLSCHCYRMCRIAHRMRAAAELGITLNSAGATLSKRTPQAVIEALPVAKYASVHHARHQRSGSISSPGKAAAGSGGSATAVAATPACAAEGSTTTSSGAPAAPNGSSTDGSGRGGTRQRGLLMSAALQIREHLARSTGVSTLPPGTSTSTSGGAAVEITPAPSGGLTPPAAASLAAGPSLLAATSLTRKSAGAASAAGTGAGAGAGPGASSSSGAEPCAICFDEFAPDDDVKQLPCGHFFHPGCIDEWLLRDITCPLCKGMVLDASMLEQQQVLAEALQTSLGSVGSIMQRTQLLARLNQRLQQQQQQEAQEGGQELAQAPASGRRRRSGNRQRRRRLSGLRQHSAPSAPSGLLGGATPAAAAEEGAGGSVAGASSPAAAAGPQQQQQQQPTGGRGRGGTMQELADMAHIVILGFARERRRAHAPGAAATAAPAAAAAPAAGAADPAGGQLAASSGAPDIELGGSRRA